MQFRKGDSEAGGDLCIADRGRHRRTARITAAHEEEDAAKRFHGLGPVSGQGRLVSLGYSGGRGRQYPFGAAGYQDQHLETTLSRGDGDPVLNMMQRGQNKESEQQQGRAGILGGARLLLM